MGRAVVPRFRSGGGGVRPFRDGGGAGYTRAVVGRG